MQKARTGSDPTIGLDCFSRVNHFYNLGHKIILQALAADEAGNQTEAKKYYLRGILEFDRAVQVSIYSYIGVF